MRARMYERLIVGLFDQLRSLFTAPAPATPQTRVEEAPQMVERRSRERVNAREGTRVLIIDDSPTIIAALKKFLRSAGYTTFEALDAETGLEVARRDKPELIFLDIVLPGMNGFAALRHLRRDIETRNIPIIMMSGNEQATEQFFGTRIGADDFMKKPFSRSEVFARIEPLLDGQFIPRRRVVDLPASSADGVEAENIQSTPTEVS